jgi:SAM-dependent methyltransferase
MIAIPAHFDHEMNARAVAACGLGVSILPHELTAAKLREAVFDVVTSSRVAVNLKRFQMILAMRRAPEHGAELVLQQAGRAKKRPKAGASGYTWFPTSPMVLEEVACDLCGETSSRSEREIEDAILANKQRYTTVRCKSCGLVYCSPRPSENSLWVLEPLEDHRKGAHSDLYTVRRLAKVDLQSRVLIAGCGAGHFAQYLLERIGCETLCVEKHPALVRLARARGLWVKAGTLGDLPEEDSGFDHILFLETLERTLSPKRALEAARERLAPGGRLVIKTANGAKPDAAIDVPRALYAFTSETLDALLRKTGFIAIRHRDGRQGNHIWCTAIPEAR